MADTNQQQQKCRTQWELYQFRTHYPSGQLHQDASGHYWCDECLVQRKLMDLAHSKGYPALKIKEPIRMEELVTLQDEPSYLNFAQHFGYSYVQSALVMLKAA